MLWPSGSFHVIPITTRHDPCGIEPNSLHAFIHLTYSHTRAHLTGDACACAERHTKITRRHIARPTLKINFSETSHCTVKHMGFLIFFHLFSRIFSGNDGKRNARVNGHRVFLAARSHDEFPSSKP